MKKGFMPGNRGFTLVELLIVLMIIAILSGMMMLAAGSSVDSAEATKVINDLKDIKTAATFYYIDTQSWPSGDPLDASARASLDRYMDGRSSGFAAARYTNIHVRPDAANERYFIGLGLKANNATPTVRKKLANNAEQSALYEDANMTPYSGTGLIVFTHLR